MPSLQPVDSSGRFQRTGAGPFHSEIEKHRIDTPRPLTYAECRHDAGNSKSAATTAAAPIIYSLLSTHTALSGDRRRNSFSFSLFPFAFFLPSAARAESTSP